MLHQVKKKQFNSKMCFVCGLDNHFGLKSFFYELDDNRLIGVFKPEDHHQSYPERLHGGITAAILDETIGRAIMIKNNPDIWGVTIEFTTRYRKPVPLNVELHVIGRITKDEKRIFEGSGEVLLPDGTVAAEGHGKYMKVTLDKITTSADISDWKIVPSDDDPVEFLI